MARYGRWVGKPELALPRVAPEREINRTLFMERALATSP